MHWSGEITVTSLVGVATLLIASWSLFLRLGGIQATLAQLLRETQQADEKLMTHEAHDEDLFREMAATLNQIVGKLGGQFK